MALTQVPQEALPIRIKGTQDGLVVNVSEALGEDWLELLEGEFRAKPDFWRGGRVVLSVGGREIPEPRLGAALELLERYGMRLWAVISENEETRRSARGMSLAIRVPGLRSEAPRERVQDAPLPSFLREVEEEPEAVDEVEIPEEEAVAAEPQPRGPVVLILKETLRSGRSVRHAGPIIVFGDVNPGAELHADGDVVVWGKLRGLVHAGAQGDHAAVVCALDLNPTQLRIADKITIPPKDPRRQPVPEMAVIREQQIIAQPWRAKA